MSYLNENYLGEQLVAPMALPSELVDRIRDNMLPLGADQPLPPGYIRLPGGIVMKKDTAILIGIAIVLFVVWYMNRKKKKK